MRSEHKDQALSQLNHIRVCFFRSKIRFCSIGYVSFPKQFL